MGKENKEIFGFSKTMFLQCIILFLGICGAVWINRNIYILTAVFTLLMCFTKDINNIYYNLFFTVSYTAIYKLNPSSTSLFVYTMIAAGIILILRIGNFNAVPMIPLSLFSVYLIFGMGNNHTTVFKMIMGMFLFFFFVKTIEADNFKNHIMAFSLGVIGSSVIGTFRNSLPQLAAYFKNEYSVYGGGAIAYRFTGLNYDPNFYSILVIFAIVLCTILIMNRTGNRLFVWTLLVSLIVFGFQSYSKMFLLSITIVVVISIISMLKYPKKIMMALAALIILGAFIVTWLKKIGYMDIMFNRLFENDISTGRFMIWEKYFEYLSNSMFAFVCGKGVGSEYLSVGGPHNTYIESIFFVGILGSTLFLTTLVLIFKYKKLNNKRHIINYLLLFVFLIMVGVLGCFTINELSFYCMLVWLGLNINVAGASNSLKGGESNVQHSSANLQG